MSVTRLFVATIGGKTIPARAEIQPGVYEKMNTNVTTRLTVTAVGIGAMFLAWMASSGCATHDPSLAGGAANRALSSSALRGAHMTPGRASGAQIYAAHRLGWARGRSGTRDARPPAPSGSLPSLDEELWVIQRAETAADGPAGSDPGCGELRAKVQSEENASPLPLEHTDVNATVDGYIATVEVAQRFHNPYDEKIEAVYVFPLPQNAAVNDFLMIIGDRKIRGMIREREEAQRVYREAKRQGYVASLLTQERPNIFTQSVANIEPGESIDLHIKYFHTLAYVDGWYEFVFPMVVGPRFNPPGSVDGVGAVGHGTSGTSGQATQVSYLRPSERSGHDVSLTVAIDAGVSIEEVKSKSHVVSVNAPSPERAVVNLSPLDAIPNKDFVLRYKVAGERIKSALMVQRGDEGGYFTLMIHPPADHSSVERSPMEMIFVLDCSGSMRGRPIEQAKAAIERGLRRLQPEDTFQIIRFSNEASQLGSRPVAVTKDSVRKGIKYLRSLRGGGGTMMIEGIKAALDFPHDPRRLRVVSFMTDGYIGNESDILREMQNRLGASRIFSFGVGSSPNRYLMNRMAKLGRGAVAYVGLHEDATVVMDTFFERISHPALTDISIDWGGLAVTELYPKRIPDLFVGRPVVLTGRFRELRETTIRITGRVGDQTRDTLLPVDVLAHPIDHEGIRLVWARKKIAELYGRRLWANDADLPHRIKEFALEHGLMSAYTAFVCVDSLTRTAGDHGTTVHVSVPVPEGVRYDSIPQE